MKRKTRNILLVVLALALAAGWLIRYITLNYYYDSMIADYTTESYSIGEVVPFGTDHTGADFMGTGLEGYSIRVDKLEIVDYDRYIAAENLTLEADPYRVNPEKLALVYVTLFNEDSDSDGVMVSELALFSKTDSIPVDIDVLMALNNGNTGVYLSPDTQYSMVIPYMLLERDFRTSVWRDLDNIPLYFQITGFPVSKIIQVQ